MGHVRLHWTGTGPEGARELWSSHGEELQADVTGLQPLGERCQFDSAAEPLVLVDDEGGTDTVGTQFTGWGNRLLQCGRMAARVDIGQSLTSARSKSPLTTDRCMSGVQSFATIHAT
ncbi:hypothetical protein [Streptomyces xiaopingdaonensis]|uniref:hypothetical protein n=1 Tax=Streptomyces xiaopingdaonensis TaxID=1565415 RepID=UPI000366F032|nr:hypothetical protein [Streptomyces xiaopingdaonensis]